MQFRHQLGKPCQLCTLLVYLGSQLFDIMIEQLGLVLHDLLINESLSDLKLLVLTDVKVCADERLDLDHHLIPLCLLLLGKLLS